MGELSPFHETFGYRADGVAPGTATVPAGWEDRLVSVSSENTGGAIGRCLEPHDLAFSKLSARREKDLAFVSALLRFRMLQASRMEALISSVDDAELRRSLAEAFEICRRR